MRWRGAGTFTVTGDTAITFGDHRGTGTTILQGPTTISASGFRLDGSRTLRNENTLTWSGGQLLFNNTFNSQSGGPGSGTLNNIAGATFIASGNAAATIAARNSGGTDTGADALISNAGTFRKSGSTASATTTVGVTFNNSGTVDVQTGILNFTNGGTHTGTFTVDRWSGRLRWWHPYAQCWHDYITTRYVLFSGERQCDGQRHL